MQQVNNNLLILFKFRLKNLAMILHRLNVRLRIGSLDGLCSIDVLVGEDAGIGRHLDVYLISLKPLRNATAVEDM